MACLRFSASSALVESALGQHARRRGQSFGKSAALEDLPLPLFPELLARVAGRRRREGRRPCA